MLGHSEADARSKGAHPVCTPRQARRHSIADAQKGRACRQGRGEWWGGGGRDGRGDGVGGGAFVGSLCTASPLVVLPHTRHSSTRKVQLAHVQGRPRVAAACMADCAHVNAPWQADAGRGGGADATGWNARGRGGAAADAAGYGILCRVEGGHDPRAAHSWASGAYPLGYSSRTSCAYALGHSSCVGCDRLGDIRLAHATSHRHDARQRPGAHD